MALPQNPYGPQTGLLGLLGLGTNPLYRSLKDGGLLDSVAYGLSSGTNLSDGLSKAAISQIGGKNDRAEWAAKATEWDTKQQQQNATKALLTKEAPDLAQLLDTGIPMGEVWGEYLRRKNPGSVQPQNPFMSAGDGKFFNWQTGQYVTDPNASPDTPTPTLTSIYDENGREQKGYMNGDTFVPVGSPKASIERPEFTNAQATAAGYADRMTQADQILDDPSLAAVQTDLTQKGLGGLPVVGNMLTSPEFQQAEQAQRDFINAILRRESGAAIAQSEFDSARKQYFPQPGDSQQVLEQKKRNRLNAIKGVARSAGPAYAAPGAGGVASGNQTSTGVTWSVEP